LLPKLLAVDLDGTLLRRDGSIHPADRDAIARLKAAGVHVTIATGRLYSGSRAAAEQCGMDGPLACVDGSQIVHATSGENLVYRGIAGGDAVALRNILERHEAAYFIFAQDGIVHDLAGDPFIGYVRTWSTNVEVVERVIHHPYWQLEEGVIAVVAVGKPEPIQAAVAELQAVLGHVCNPIMFPVTRIDGTWAMIVRAVGTTKGTAISWLAEHHGISVDEVVVVGDWINDLPMFRVAGRSFAMGQAPEHVKAAATDHLQANGAEGGGIAEAIAKVWG
jgi:hypothetical protein